jgi:hypothetical protein
MVSSFSLNEWTVDANHIIWHPFFNGEYKDFRNNNQTFSALFLGD